MSKSPCAHIIETEARRLQPHVEPGQPTPKSTRPLLILVIGALLFALFFPVIRWLVGEWLGNDFYSHGLLVPFISAFLAWRLWSRRPPAMTTNGNSWAGLALTGGSLIVYLLALMQRAYFIAALAMIVILVGLVWYLVGAVGPAAAGLPDPLPALYDPAALRRAAQRAAGAGHGDGRRADGQAVRRADLDQRGAGDAAEREPGGRRAVQRPPLHRRPADAGGAVRLCGGRADLGQGAARVSAIPIAAFGNIVRVTSLLGVAHVWGADIGFTYYHDYSGILFFASAVLLLILASRMVQCNEIRSDLF